MIALLQHIQGHARESVPAIANALRRDPAAVRTGMQRLLNSGAILRFTTLVNWLKMNLVWSHLVIQSSDQQAMARYLALHPNVNNLYSLRDGSLHAETVFADLACLYRFLEGLSAFDVISIEEYYVIEPLAESGDGGAKGFLTSSSPFHSIHGSQAMQG
jgi:DNA-binding Lrp family transcriptional regulator